MPSEPITLEEAKQFVSYDNQKGTFFWNSGNKIGKQASIKHGKGYRILNINEHKILEHRLVYLFENGNWPKGYIDHIDGNCSNNKIENLRDCSHQQNIQNRKKHKNNSCGLKGVYYKIDKKKWYSQIRCDGIKYHLGGFKTKEEASKAYQEAAKKLFGEFNRKSP